MRKRARQPTLAAIARREWLLQMLAVGVAGCRGPDERIGSHRTTVTVAYDESALNEDYDEWDKRLVFLPLITENEKGELEGRLAERWEHSADYRQWMYHLRPGVRWHDGVPVTAYDLKFSLDFLARPEVGGRLVGFESVEVHDERTVTVRTGRFADEYQLWPICYPKHRLAHLDPKTTAQWEFWSHPVGNGPYRFVRYVPQTMIEYEANPDYYRGKRPIERVRLKFVERGSPLTELLGGNVDSANLAPADIAALSGDPRFEVYYEGANSMDGRFVSH